jgi:NADPH:quinone reductase-like Zn-dependent oxidoreductase
MPVPRRNQIRIRVAATAVTSSDCYVRGLNLPARYRVAARLALGLTGPRQRILGMVLAGEVESTGADVTAFGCGDQVFGFDRHAFGTYAQYVCWPQDTVLAAMPGGLTHEEAAAIPYGGLLALHFPAARGRAPRPVGGRVRGFRCGRHQRRPTRPALRSRRHRRMQRRERRTRQVAGSRHRDRLHRR